MSTLFLLLPAEPANAASEYLYIQSSDGQQAGQGGQAAASLLPPATRTGQTVAVIAWPCLSWHQVALPPGLNLHSRRQQTRVRAVLEGLLEERLLDEPAQLHLALQPQAASGQGCWIAACDRAWLHGHMRNLQDSGHAVARLVPELAPAPEPQLWAMGGADAPWLLATGLDGASTLARLPLRSDAAALQSVLARLPQQTPVLAEPQLARAVEALPHPVALQTQAQRMLAAAAQSWDLAQFEFDQGANSRLRRRLLDAWQGFAKAPQWRAARWGTAVALLAQLIGLNAWAWKENRDIAARQQQVRQVLQATFAHVPVIVDAPVQMQRELDLLRAATGALAPGDLEPLLAASARIDGIHRAAAIEYQDRQLRLQGLAFDAAALEAAQQALAGSGYRLQRTGEALVLAEEAPR